MKPELPRVSAASLGETSRHPRRTALALGTLAILGVGALAACTSNSSSSSSGSSASAPATGSASAAATGSGGTITIGASLSLTGDFSADGQAFQKGYNLWAKDVNAKGGILGKQVVIKVLNDASQPNQAVTNYQTLINSDHVDLTFGPFSSLLTTPSSAVAARAGFAFIEGAGGAPTVFNAPSNTADHNTFDVSLPIADEFLPFTQYIASLPASQRPKTAAYPAAQDPFADPPVANAQAALEKLGVKTVYSKVFPAEVASYKPAADQVAAANPDLVVLGSTDVPTVSAFMSAFEQQHYTPKLFLAAAGPDQGADFIKAVGAGNAVGMMVPNGWYPSYDNAASKAMVAEYVAQNGGAASDVNADVAEAYSVGQVAAAAITATGGTDNAKIIAWLHGGNTIDTVQGSVKFDSLGQNADAAAFIFQWQKGSNFVQVLPSSSSASVAIINPKPAWQP